MTTTYTILMSNLAYGRGFNGALADHVRFAHRHLYCPPKVQEESLRQLRELIAREKPDICCLLEIDRGSLHSAYFDQLKSLLNEQYDYFDIESKYGSKSPLRFFSLTGSRSNAFIARRSFDYEKLYFAYGIKRLIYKIKLAPEVTLFFAHFSLKKRIRALQLQQVRELFAATPGKIVFLGDFNLLTGLQELEPILHDRLILLNRPDQPTFTFHRRKLVLDLCLCSPELAPNSNLTVIPQPYSDHAALLLKMKL